MTPDQVEVLSKLVTLTSAAAAVALALAQTAKTLLEIADKLVKRRRRARQRARPSGTGRRPRRHGKDAAARRSAPPRRGCRRGPRPGPGRGRAPPDRRRARRGSPVKRHEPPIFWPGSEKPRSNGASPEKVSAHQRTVRAFCLYHRLVIALPQ